jgi:hypothetical protein
LLAAIRICPLAGLICTQPSCEITNGAADQIGGCASVTRNIV